MSADDRKKQVMKDCATVLVLNASFTRTSFVLASSNPLVGLYSLVCHFVTLCGVIQRLELESDPGAVTCVLTDMQTGRSSAPILCITKPCKGPRVNTRLHRHLYCHTSSQHVHAKQLTFLSVFIFDGN